MEQQSHNYLPFKYTVYTGIKVLSLSVHFRHLGVSQHSAVEVHLHVLQQAVSMAFPGTWPGGLWDVWDSSPCTAFQPSLFSLEKLLKSRKDSQATRSSSTLLT